MDGSYFYRIVKHKPIFSNDLIIKVQALNKKKYCKRSCSEATAREGGIA
jgi:hypothetical protein